MLTSTTKISQQQGERGENGERERRAVMDMEEIVWGIVCMLLLLAIIPLLWYRRRRFHTEEEEQQHSQEEVEPLVQRDRTARRPGASRMRRRTAAAVSASVPSSSATIEESDEDDYEAEYNMGKQSTKKGKKKQEREEQRQAEEAARESKERKRDYYDEMRRRKDEEREAKDRLMEEEALARKAKEEEAAALEFEKWKGEFSIDGEGTTENDMQDGSQGLLADFIEYIKKQKCVPLEELAAEFKLRTQECINRITTLESAGRLSGVMDDRGKYIYISPEEMKAVADYIKRQGRVSISHLASKSNQFIDLEPKSQPMDEISNTDGITVV